MEEAFVFPSSICYLLFPLHQVIE